MEHWQKPDAQEVAHRVLGSMERLMFSWFDVQILSK